MSLQALDLLGFTVTFCVPFSSVALPTQKEVIEVFYSQHQGVIATRTLPCIYVLCTCQDLYTHNKYKSSKTHLSGATAIPPIPHHHVYIYVHKLCVVLSIVSYSFTTSSKQAGGGVTLGRMLCYSGCKQNSVTNFNKN